MLVMILLSIATVSCGKEEPKPVNENAERAVLVYAVNNNNLHNYFDKNCTQMLIAAGNLDLAKSAIYVYSTTTTGCVLRQVVLGNGTPSFKTIMNYNSNELSTNPDRFAAVINDFIDITPGAVRTLMLWGHGMGWSPYFSSHNPSDITPGPLRPSLANPGEMTAYGGEGGYPNRDWLDIKEIDANIPDDAFKTLWFDACYMGSIEVMYELRDKADYIVASPTEVAGQGLNYDKALPFILAEHPDYAAAMDAFLKYYNDAGLPATGVAIKTAELESIAQAAHSIFSQNEESVSYSGLTNYSRDSDWPYIDFVEYAERYVEGREEQGSVITELKDKVEAATIHKVHTRYDFKNHVLPETICCISLAPQPTGETEADKYYRTLEWYNAVYK